MGIEGKKREVLNHQRIAGQRKKAQDACTCEFVSTLGGKEEKKTTARSDRRVSQGTPVSKEELFEEGTRLDTGRKGRYQSLSSIKE